MPVIEKGIACLAEPSYPFNLCLPCLSMSTTSRAIDALHKVKQGIKPATP